MRIGINQIDNDHLEVINPFPKGFDLVHYFYHIFVDGKKHMDDWDRNNDFKDEAKIKKILGIMNLYFKIFLILSDLKKVILYYHLSTRTK